MNEPNVRATTVPTLSVDAAETGLRFRLDRPSQGQHEPLQEEYVQRVDPTTLAALLGSADELLRGSPRSGLAAEARRRGGVLYRTLIPDVLAAQLRAVDGPLAVRTSVFGVPWELLHDGQEFWGIRYAIGRRLVIDRPVAPVRHVRVSDRPRALVVGADPRHDLPSVGREIEAIALALASRADVVCVGTQLAGLDAVIDYFGQGFDLIHFAGHIVTGAAGEVGLLVGDGRVLRASAIPAALTGRPLVMLNGCGSARSTAAGRGGNWEESLSGVAHGFLFGGAIAVVGTLAEVRDRPATTIALGFYRHLLARERVGEALRRARDECRRDPEGADTADWLSFVLYGSPALSLVDDDTQDRDEVGRRRRRRFRRRGNGGDRPLVTRRTVLIGGALVASGIGIGLLQTRTFRPAPRPAAIGVMSARVVAGDVPSWMREFTRHSLSTTLKEVGELSIFSQEKIDFLCETRRLCGIAGAEALGMTRMITPSLSIAGDRVALEVEVIDVARDGLLEFNERVQGPSSRFIELQNELLLRLLARLGVAPTDQERARILNERTNDMLESYRMLVETLGGQPPPAPPVPSPSERSGRLSLVREAWADDAASDEAAIRAVLRDYAAALTARNVDDIEKLQVRMTPEQHAAMAAYFANAAGLRVEFSSVEVLLSGKDALASYVREDWFTDARLNRPMHLKVQLSTRLEKTPDGWRLKLGE